MIFLACLLITAEPALGKDQSALLDGPVQITHTRPEWLKDGIVMAGNWSSLTQREHRIDASWVRQGYKLSEEEAREAYRREISPEMADRLKELGCTLVMMPLYSGHGTYEEEFPGMEDSKRFAELVHERGMHVGVYIHMGMFSKSVLDAQPEAYNWLAWPSLDKTWPPPPPATESEGCPVYRNHPAYQAYMRRLIDYAIREVKADLLHFDNYVYTSGWSPQAIEDFRAWLRRKFKPEELDRDFGGRDLNDIGMRAYNNEIPAAIEWQFFQAWTFGDAFRKLSEYARSLNPEVATEVNASGIGIGYRQPIDLSLLLPYGDCLWDEQAAASWDPKKRILVTGIRTYKVARLFKQSAFTYAIAGSRLPISESMAFNYDSLGCLYWFLYGRVNWPVTRDNTADERLMPETRFYRENRELFNEGDTLADAAVWRSRAVNVPGQDIHAFMAMFPEFSYKEGTGFLGYTPRSWEAMMGKEDPISACYLYEQALIAQHVPFEIIFDQHLKDLSKYRAVILPDVRRMEEHQIELLLNYVRNGGGLVITGQTATEDAWGRPRPDGLIRFLGKDPAQMERMLVHRGKGRIVYARMQRPATFTHGSLPANDRALAEAVAEAMGGPLSVQTDAPVCYGMEFVKQKDRLLVQVMDYSNNTEGRAFHLNISPALGKVMQCRLLSPRQEAVDLAVEMDGEISKIAVPKVDLYGVIVME